MGRAISCLAGWVNTGLMRGGDEQRESRDWIYVVHSVVVRRNVRVLYLRLCVCVLYME